MIFLILLITLNHEEDKYVLKYPIIILWMGVTKAACEKSSSFYIEMTDKVYLHGFFNS